MFSAAAPLRAISLVRDRWELSEFNERFSEFSDFGRGFEQALSAAWCGAAVKTPALGGLGAKNADAFPIDGIGDDKAPAPIAPLLVTVDAQPGDSSTAATISVDGAHIVSTIDTVGDLDFFRVELEAGGLYNIGQYLVTAGPSGVPLSDAYIELYDADGNLIVTADGGGPNTPSGLDALLTYEAEYTGTYYINARAFDQEAANGTNGDFVGDYELFVDSVDPNDPLAYRPLYTPDQPMHSIDWGSQVDRTSRNPDGENGPRDNGAPDTGVVYNPQFDIYGKNVITYYFAQTGELYVDEEAGGLATMVAEGFQQWEKDAFRLALDEYERVTDNIYIEVFVRAEADFKFVTYEGTPGVGASLLGRMSSPNEPNEGQAEFNAGDARWTEAGLQPGGFYFPTLLHELGHGHGMAHPHDNGGRSSIMPGADGGTGGLGGGFGDWGLSQQVFTIMSYNDGWNEDAAYGARPLGHGGPRSGGITGTEVDHFGWVGTLTALDIAVLQDKYGVNEEWATGDDVYTIGDVNGPGSFYSCIWDAAGTDEIRYVGARNAYIDLRAATLEYEEGGGGWVSYALGAWTGFTIANGVTIENATGGDGDDTLVANAAANTLNGGAGVDTASYAGSSAAVTVNLTQNTVSGGDAAGDTLIGFENVSGSAFNDTLIGNGGVNALWGEAGNDTLYGMAANDALNGDGGDDRLLGGVGADALNGGAGVDLADYSRSTVGVEVNLTLNRGVGGEAQGDTFVDVENILGTSFVDLLTGSDGDNFVYGLAGDDKLWGNAGNDILIGAAGADILTGGAGVDATSYHTSASAVRVVLFDKIGRYGEAEGDRFGSIENIIGSAFNDEIFGDNAANELHGQAGADNLYGNTGNDELEGGDGDDKLYGQDGNDIVSGGAGFDRLFGGIGADTFVYRGAGESTSAARDQIGDFSSAQGDKINLMGIDANTSVGGDQAFAFIGSAAFSSVAGQLRYAGNLLEGDINGDGVADFQIELNVASMQASDFWL